MAATLAERRRPVEVIDLCSDSEDADTAAMDQTPEDALAQVDSDVESAMYHSPRLGGDMPEPNFLDGDLDAEAAQQDQVPGGSIINIDGEEIFIPDEELEVPNALLNRNVERDQEVLMALDGRACTADDCLRRVLDIFPDISHEYIIDLYNGFEHEGDYELLPGQARLDNIIEQLVSANSYPKQEKGKQALKRKRQASIDDYDVKKWEHQDRVGTSNHLKGSIQAILKAEFPDITVQYINETLATQHHLFQAFIALAKAKDNSEGSNRAYGRGRPSTKNLADAPTIAGNCGTPELHEELNAARQRVEVIRAERAAEDEQKRAEHQNLQRAIEAGETAECSACFDELPMNRQIHCDGTVAHFTCFVCAHTYIKAEVGESRCRVLCTAGCGSGFASRQLTLIADKPLLAKLAQLQQEKDIRDAGLDDLEECPFCDYKAILPPIEEDFEFRCANPECEKVSCRRCKSVSHIPISCEQHAKDNQINSRHKIEEAMTAALIRACKKCKKQFIKQDGCNKMSCPCCGNLQCYVCSTTIRDYNHFDQGPRGIGSGSTANSKLCPLYDNVEQRHEQEVKEAEAAARAQVIGENPDVRPEDLEIKVSAAVNKATTDRIKRGGRFPGAAMRFDALQRLVDQDEDDEDGDGDDDEEDLVLNEGHRLHRAVERARGRRERAQRLRDAFVNNNPPVPNVPDPRYIGRVHGYIPVIGFQPPLPLQQPPPGPHMPNNPVLQPPPAPLGQPFHRHDGMFGYNQFPPPIPNNNNHHHHHNIHHNQPHLHAPAPNMPGAFPGMTQPPPAFAPQAPQPLMAGHREHLQAFQQVEMLRQRHVLMYQREMARNAQAQQRQQELRAMQHGHARRWLDAQVHNVLQHGRHPQ